MLALQLLLVLSAGDSGGVWEGVRKEGNKLMPFNGEDNQALEQVDQRGAVSFLDTFQDWNSLVWTHYWPCFEQEAESLEIPSNHCPVSLSSGSGRGSILGRCVERSVRCRCIKHVLIFKLRLLCFHHSWIIFLSGGLVYVQDLTFLVL